MGLEEEIKKVDKLKAKLNKKKNKFNPNMLLELHRVHNTSEWFSVRDYAGKSMVYLDDEVDRQVPGWINRLSEKMNSNHEKTVSRKAYTGYDNVTTIMPDKRRRITGARDLSMLYRLSGLEEAKRALERAYDSNEVKKVREIAGDALGYPRFHFHLKEIFSGIIRLFYRG